MALLTLNKQIKSNSGFSLIEIIIAIVIMASVFTAGFLSLQRFNKDKNLNLSYDNFVNAVYEAKSDSLSQVKTSTVLCAPTQTLAGYQVKVDGVSSPNSYTLSIVCSIPSDPVTYTTTPIKKVILPNDVNIDLVKVNPPGAAVSFMFLTPSGLVGESYSATLTSGSRSKSVGIDNNGVILQE